MVELKTTQDHNHITSGLVESHCFSYKASCALFYNSLDLFYNSFNTLPMYEMTGHKINYNCDWKAEFVQFPDDWVE